MRSDMAKVVTERPRYGHHNPSVKTGMTIRRYDPEAEYELPFRAPVSASRQYGYDAKEFSDLLGPLKGYLKAQVGRPWNNVYSELSRTLDSRTLAGRHIWTHVRQEVVIDCHLEGMVVYPNVEYRYGTVRPVEGLYVHPINGLLCFKAPRRNLRSRGRSKTTTWYDLEQKFELKPKPFVADDWMIIDDLTVLQRRDGIWFIHVYKALDPNQIVGRISVEGKESLVYLRDMTKCFKAKVKMQQLGRKHPLWSRVKHG